MEQCDACAKTFKTKSSLQRHLTTACKSLAKKDYECEHCTYTTPLKYNFARHIAGCKYVYAAEQTLELEKKQEELQESIETLQREKEAEVEKVKLLRKKIKDLKAENINYRLQLEEKKGRITVYNERPTPTINNNYINPKLLQIKCDTIRPFTIETVREDVQAGKFTFDRFIQAEKGLLDFISDIIAQDSQFSYVCTDSSRQKFHRLLESREWKDDNGATFLNKVLDELKEPTTEYYKRVTDMMVNGDKDTAEFLLEKTKPMAMGITCPRSKSRDATFSKIRNEVKKLATV